eukprot:CAMPEP_0204003702 /NCGR_PEP_ID=MMETSP0360-20130528/17861_1 /ASSEMBLY_ACC=CAM_ASM_000342 /TAXON_ID=268821 /ORGANISM="Scrippsiella Hangoei, Strain SHTV-5" /LENGTH=165 /DNA_ID=CAMNT_0050945469 /DNA_START=347 /DNA_END=844 /DNA_ORIENTATION=-
MEVDPVAASGQEGGNQPQAALLLRLAALARPRQLNRCHNTASAAAAAAVAEAADLEGGEGCPTNVAVRATLDAQRRSLLDHRAVRERQKGEGEAQHVQPRGLEAKLLAGQTEEAEEARQPSDEQRGGPPSDEASAKPDLLDNEDRAAIPGAPDGATSERERIEGR